MAAVAQERHVPAIHFLGEQEGAPEGLLKRRLSAAFGSHRQLGRAYLALVRYADEAAVALCLSCTGDSNQQLTEAVAEVFASIFGAHEHLDIVFLSEEQERVLRRVCRPFYPAPSWS